MSPTPISHPQSVMRKRPVHAVYTAAAVLLFIWSVLEWLRLLRTFIDRLQGGRSACSLRDETYTTLIRELQFAALSTGTARRIHADTQEFVAAFTPDLETPWRRVRIASSRLLQISKFCDTPARKPPYDLLEWTIASRYPTDGPLLHILSVIGFLHESIVVVDDARADGTAHAALAPAMVHNYHQLISSHRSWSAAHSARQLYPPNALVLESGSTPSFTTTDALMLFMEHGTEAEILKKWIIRPRILVSHYRDFLGCCESLVRTTNVTRIPFISGLDRARAAPTAGYSLGGLVALASKYRYRLVWCVRAYPIAIFVHQNEDDLFLPTLTPSSCYARRASDRSFRADMEALWDISDGSLWSKMRENTSLTGPFLL